MQSTNGTPDTPEQRLEAAIEKTLTKFWTNTFRVSIARTEILAAVTAELRAIIPEKAPESIIDIEGGDGNRDDCVKYGEDKGWNQAIDHIISKAKERGINL